MPGKPAKGNQARRTQAERREQTQRKMLESACKVFGEKGYADTSIEDIATEAGVTISPIYHYFGNKLALFQAATEHMESRLVSLFQQLEGDHLPELISNAWVEFVKLCKEPGFVQIVLVDAPHFLGRERWQDTAVVTEAAKIMAGRASTNLDDLFGERDRELLLRMTVAALAEAAMMVGRNPDYDGREVINWLLGMLSRPLSAS